MAFIVGLGCVVLLLQMFAVSQLNTSQNPDRDSLTEIDKIQAPPFQIKVRIRLHVYAVFTSL